MKTSKIYKGVFILFELSYDQYNDNKDRIYRVILNGKLGGQEVRVTSTASVIAIPLIWWVADSWLQNYYYRIYIEVFDFLYGFLMAIFIALITISYRTIKTAKANPTENLRYE